MAENTDTLWYYSEGSQQKGPVEQSAFIELVRRGTIAADTLVWRSGMATWQPYGQVAGSAAAASGAGEVPCHYCGKVFPTAELIDFGGTRVCAACKPLFVQQVKENAEVSAPLQLQYAGFWIRVGAYFVDNILCTLLTYAVTLPLLFAVGHGSSPSAALATTGLNMLLSMSISFVYMVVPLVKWGATPGKMACGLKVVRADGSPLTYGRAIGRFFGNMLSSMILCIGYLMVAFDKREHKALHDVICDTRVVYKNR